MSLNKKIEIQEPLHIPAVIETAREISNREHNSFYLLLDHKEEPCIIRGRGQKFSGEFNRRLGYHVIGDIPEIKRQDGGNTWYHGETTCLVRVSPENKSSVIFNNNFMFNWQEDLKDFYRCFSDRDLFHTKGKADLYELDGVQVMGTSGMNASVARACWYEEQKNNVEGLENLINRDPQTKGCDVMNNVGYANQGFSDFLFYCLDIVETIPSSQYISSSSYKEALRLQQKDGRLIGPCIGGKYPKK